MNLKIGKIYNITYHKPSEHKQTYETVLCELKDSEKQSIIEYLQNNAQKIQYAFQQRKIILCEYLRAVRKLNTLKNKKELYARKTDKMIALEESVKIQKGVFFPKKESTQQEKSRNLFIREYDPQYVQFYKNVQNDSIQVIYAGKTITANGLIKHKWFALSGANIVKQYVNTEYMNIIKK